MTTFFLLADSLRGQPVLQTCCPPPLAPGGVCLPVVLSMHVVTVRQSEPLSEHVVPEGQHVYPLAQQTAFAYGQQPHLPSDGIHFCTQHVAVDGHAVRLYACESPPHVDQTSSFEAMTAVLAAEASSFEARAAASETMMTERPSMSQTTSGRSPRARAIKNSVANEA
jgi:hypothetical protein